MLNETLNLTQTCKIPTYESVHSMMINPIVLVVLCLIYFVPIFIYIVIGLTARGRSSSGEVTSKCMFHYPNSFYALITWIFIQGGLFTLLVYPVWLLAFSC